MFKEDGHTNESRSILKLEFRLGSAARVVALLALIVYDLNFMGALRA